MTNVFHHANYFLLGGVTLALFVFVTEAGFRLALSVSQPLLDRFWTLGTMFAKKTPTAISSLFLQSVNDAAGTTRCRRSSSAPSTSSSCSCWG
jgi:hypothetical protein